MNPKHRLDKRDLLSRISDWDAFFKRRVHLIACGGTALTLIGVKESTKDIDFIVPREGDYTYLIRVLKELGYRQSTGSGWKRQNEPYSFDLFCGNRIQTTELLESPLEEKNNILIKEFAHIYLGVLNYYDLIISKMFRGETQDFEDCLTLINAKRKEIDLDLLRERFKETASYDIAEERVSKQLESLLRNV